MKSFVPWIAWNDCSNPIRASACPHLSWHGNKCILKVKAGCDTVCVRAKATDPVERLE